MQAIQSIVRHVVVPGITILFEKYQFPVESSQDAANAVALGLVALTTWAISKYGPKAIKGKK